MAKSKSTRTPVRKGLSDRKAAAVLRNYEKRPALMSQDTVFELDDAIRADRFGTARRMALLMLTKPCAELIQEVSKDRKFALAAAAFAGGISSYRSALDDLRDWIEESEKRILVALATLPDMTEVFAEAQAEVKEVAHV